MNSDLKPDDALFHQVKQMYADGVAVHPAMAIKALICSFLLAPDQPVRNVITETFDVMLGIEEVQGVTDEKATEFILSKAIAWAAAYQVRMLKDIICDCEEADDVGQTLLQLFETVKDYSHDHYRLCMERASFAFERALQDETRMVLANDNLDSLVLEALATNSVVQKDVSQMRFNLTARPTYPT